MSSRLSALLIITLALCLCGMGAALTAAGMARYQADAFMDNWASKAGEPDAQAWAVAVSAARTAIKWYPVPSGEYLDRLGRVYAWRYFQHSFGANTALAGGRAQASAVDAGRSRRAALDAYRGAVAVRPAWPGSWARLAHAKLYLLELDGEFEQAFLRAADQGPWRGPVNRELAGIGLVAWDVMPADARQRTVEQAARAMLPGDADSLAVLELARQAGVESRVCAELEKMAPTSQGKCR